ncbi:MAG: outer membrane beta-barrel protein [Acidobacteriota bacterium]|jgi:hypothetical protein
MKASVLFIVLLASIPCDTGFAQSLSAGVMGGVPLTDPIWSNSNHWPVWYSESKPYVVGPAIELRLRTRLTVEFDALYRHTGYRMFWQVVNVSARDKTVTDSWEFPLVARYRVFSARISPIVTAGVTFRHLYNLHSIYESAITPTYYSQQQLDSARELRTKNNWGGVAGIGIETRIWKIRVLPQMRYTRWNSDAFRDPYWSPGVPLDNRSGETVKSSRDQFDFLIGIMFGF